MPGDFLTALLAASILEKVPGADILYDVRASRAVPDTVTRLGGNALVNRVGHAFFKTRMRDEGGEFGGEVSGHYYFKAFYNADSGTIPALLILELLSKRDTTLAELLHEFRTKYFISGEINSTVDDQRAKMDEIKARYADARSHRARRRLDRLRRLALQRAPVQHRAAAAAQPREPRVPGGHGAAARRGARADPLVSAIHCLPIPTPFRVGRVNCYLIDDDPLTLVDVGPNSARSLVALEDALREHGHRLEDLERIVITHQHADHLGLVGIVADRSGAEVCALDVLAPVVEDFGTHADHNDELAQALMLRHGLARDVVTALAAMSRAFRGWGGSAPVTHTLRDGGELAFADRTFEVQHRPGHSPSDTVFWDANDGLLLAGDHLIGHISSNPLIAQPLGGRSGEPGSGRPRALLMYLESLKLTRELPVRTVLPGHGIEFDDHAALIDERFEMHERRAEKMLGLIAERPRSAHDIAQTIWGNVAVTQAYLTLSEVLGHVDLLVERGEVVETEVGGVVHFTTARSGGQSRSSSSRCWSRWPSWRPPRARSTCRTRSCS